MLDLLNQIAFKLMGEKLVTFQWAADTQEQGELVKLCRDYYDGFHRMQLTKEMKAMLNISDERLERYNINYCGLVIDRMADRLTVEKFEATTEESGAAPTPINSLTTGTIMSQPDASAATKVIDPAQEWVDDLMKYNRFDGLQRDVTVAYLRDGLTFVMCQYDDVAKAEYFCQEDAYDGEVGTLVIYQRGSSSEIAAAVKIWYDVPPTPEQVVEGDTNISQYKRVNIYYPNRTDKYYSTDGKSMVSIDATPEETTRNNTAPGVPVVPFYNKNGVSELVNLIPLQDSLNSQLVDLVMAGRLTAFSIVLAVNLSVPQAITPGMTITKNIIKDGVITIPETAEDAGLFSSYLNAARLERLPVGDLSQIIKGIELIIAQIAVISSTPLPGQMGSDAASGEALKQREVGMLGKLKRAQVALGNSWEDVIWLANMQQQLFGATKPPMIDDLDTRWKSAEIRNDTDVLALFKLLNEAGYRREALRVLGQSSLASYTDKDIENILNEKSADDAKQTVNAAGSLPGFDQFNIPSSNAMNFNPPAQQLAG